MNPNVLYWTGALINMVVLVLIATSGVRHIRSGEVVRHRRSMLIASGLVVAFLFSYVLKLIFLGREDLASWERVYVHTLRFHELCVLLMVVGGGFALVLGRKLGGTSAFLDSLDAPEASAQLRRRHRIAGRTALVGAVLGIASAAFVLVGMYARS